MPHLTTTQVQEQKERFESFLVSANLIKIGARIIHFMTNNAFDGRYTPYVYPIRVLKQLANVDGNYVHPDNTKRSYRDLLETAAVTAYVDSLNATIK